MPKANSSYINRKTFPADRITHLEIQFIRDWLTGRGVRELDNGSIIRAAICNYAQYLQSSNTSPQIPLTSYKETTTYRSE